MTRAALIVAAEELERMALHWKEESIAARACGDLGWANGVGYCATMAMARVHELRRMAEGRK